jgi:hypothetical protein
MKGYKMLSLFFVVLCSFTVGSSVGHFIWSPETTGFWTWSSLICGILAVALNLIPVYKAVKHESWKHGR